MFSVIKHYKFWFIFSGVLTVGSLALLVMWGLKPGIDFRGGTLTEMEFQKAPDINQLRDELTGAAIKGVTIQPVSTQHLIIKTEPLNDQLLAKYRAILVKFGESKELKFDAIGPSIGRELVHKAYWQIILVCFGIILYISYSFRKISTQAKSNKITSWRMGVAAVIALIHDLTIVVGLFVILGKYQAVDIDNLFVTALLTILGFSVHDTIVVFDRIRENLALHPYKSLGTIIDYSINSTLARSINTSSTLIFVLIAMLLFGGQTIYY